MRQVLPALLAAGLLAGAIADVALWYPHLPNVVPTRFDFQGSPVAWMGKSTFTAMMIGLLSTVAVLFTGNGLLVRRLPNRCINLPRRDYWLAPQRRERTLRFVNSFLMWIGVATLALLWAVMHATLRVGMAVDARLHWIATAALVAYLAGIAIAVGLILGRFCRTP